MLMCGGDGLADIFGRKYGKNKLTWNKGKTWAGSLGMFLGGWILSVVIVWLYCIYGIFPQPIRSFLIPITIISFAGTLVESLPYKDIDNITVTFTAILLGYIFF
jgi:phytol kinase